MRRRKKIKRWKKPWIAKVTMTPTPEDEISVFARGIGKKGNNVLKFSIHYRAKIGGKWTDVIRCDNKKHEDHHGAHLHLYYLLDKDREFEDIPQDRDDPTNMYRIWLREIKIKHRKFRDLLIKNLKN